MLGFRWIAGRIRARTSLVLVLPVALVAFTLTGCSGEAPPRIVGAVAGNHSATVSWLPPIAAQAPIVAYVVTPVIGTVSQNPTVFNSAATTQTVTGLTNGVAYTFQVSAINSIGSQTASSEASNVVSPNAVATSIAAGAQHTC